MIGGTSLGNCAQKVARGEFFYQFGKMWVLQKRTCVFGIFSIPRFIEGVPKKGGGYLELANTNHKGRGKEFPWVSPIL